MPEPDWMEGVVDPFETPDTAMEILGRGPASRQSKTFLPNIRIATQLDLIKTHYLMLVDLFRLLHMRHYEVEETWEDEDGKKHSKMVPERLTQQQIHERYPFVAAWYNIHQGAVEHYASIEGFSVDRTMGGMRVQKPRDEDEDHRNGSSAGTDRRERREAGGRDARWG